MFLFFAALILAQHARATPTRHNESVNLSGRNISCRTALTPTGCSFNIFGPLKGGVIYSHFDAFYRINGIPFKPFHFDTFHLSQKSVSDSSTILCRLCPKIACESVVCLSIRVRFTLGVIVSTFCWNEQMSVRQYTAHSATAIV